MAKQDNGMGSFTWGALLGTLAGAVIAILFAPRSGKETLDEIENTIENTASDVRNTAADVRRQIEGDSVQDSLAAAKAEARRMNQQ
jgi:gas vesicle protein